ncbi:hypothetical protein C4888_11845, partial [Streptococcus agalactiae]
ARLAAGFPMGRKPKPHVGGHSPSRRHEASQRAQRRDALRFWRHMGMFSPQSSLELTSRTAPPEGLRVIEWNPDHGDDRLPWNHLVPPRPTRTTPAPR